MGAFLYYLCLCVLYLERAFRWFFGEHTEQESSEQLLKELADGDRLAL